MRRRILLFLPFLAGAVWHWLWEFIKLFYERGSRMLTPFFDSVPVDDLLRWGPTIAFPALGVWLIWRARRFSPPVIKTTEWKKPFEAVERFGDQPLVAAKNKWRKDLTEASESLYETAKKIAELERHERKEPTLAGGGPPPKSPEFARQRRLRQVAVLQEPFAADELRRIWADLREDIGAKLESGELAAKGILAPYLAGKGETEIAPHEW
jgi:hypothetical protein